MSAVDPFVFATDAVFDPTLYHRFYLTPPERSDQEIAFLVHNLSLDRPCRILDLACGHGRHANRLAAMGHRVTGLDRSEAFLSEARADATVMGVDVDYVLADMRSLGDVLTYDLVICLFTAFGYFPDAENLAVVGAVARSLVPGGRLILDVINRDRVLRQFRDLSVVERDNDVMIDRSRFDSQSGRIITQRTYIMNGRRTEAPFSVRLYHLQEITSMLASVGLKVEQAYGDFKGAPVSWEHPRLVVVGRKGDL